MKPEEELLILAGGKGKAGNYQESEEVKKLRAVIVGMYDKLETLAGQESSMGFMKQKSDIGDYELQLETAIGDVLNQKSNTGGAEFLGGLRGVLFALFVRCGKDVGTLPSKEQLREIFMGEDGDEGTGSGWGDEGYKPLIPLGGISTQAEAQAAVSERRAKRVASEAKRASHVTEVCEVCEATVSARAS